MRHSLLLALTAALALTGCSQHPHPAKVADVPKGIYYTTDEVRGLTTGERDAYCEALDRQIQVYRAEASRLLVSADSLSKAADSLKSINSALVTEIRDMDNEIRQLRLARRSATTYLVKAGDTLQKIASEVYGKQDLWRDIYEANKDLVKNPNEKLKPGIRLTIPAK